MINVLCRIFVKNYKDTKNPKVRLEYGIFAGIVGIICNIVLFLTKLTAGFLTSSLSIMADAINNLSDAGSSIIPYIIYDLNTFLKLNFEKLYYHIDS